MAAPQVRVFYRIVKSNPPTLLDFTSPEAEGKPFTHPDPSRRRLWSGLSCHATEAQARRNARRYRTHGRFIAAVRVEENGPIRIERTLGPGHYTLWGDPSHFMQRVISVTSVA